MDSDDELDDEEDNWCWLSVFISMSSQAFFLCCNHFFFCFFSLPHNPHIVEGGLHLDRVIFDLLDVLIISKLNNRSEDLYFSKNYKYEIFRIICIQLISIICLCK